MHMDAPSKTQIARQEKYLSPPYALDKGAWGAFGAS